MAKQKGFDPKALPYILALAQAIQIGHAGYILMGWIGAFVGGVIGAGVSFSVAYSGSQIASINGQKREKWANVAMFAMLTLSPLLITAAAYISFAIIPFEWLRWVTAGSWALAPDLSVFLSGLIAGRKLVASEDKPATSKTKPVKAEKPRFACAICGFEAKSQAALNGHKRKHSKPIGYKVSFEPVTEQEKEGRTP
jgi:phosphate/sulfate permease